MSATLTELDPERVRVNLERVHERIAAADRDPADVEVCAAIKYVATECLPVLAADCLPVALAGGGRVAIVHCGWRGLAAGIVARGVATFAEPPSAAVGPGIGRCCYEVGDEVKDAFANLDGVVSGRMLDLRAAADAKLRAAGVHRIEHVDLCTSCREDLFFSHRRDRGVTGRQAGVAWLTG